MEGWGGKVTLMEITLPVCRPRNCASYSQHQAGLMVKMNVTFRAGQRSLLSPACGMGYPSAAQISMFTEPCVACRSCVGLRSNIHIGLRDPMRALRVMFSRKFNMATFMVILEQCFHCFRLSTISTGAGTELSGGWLTGKVPVTLLQGSPSHGLKSRLLDPNFSWVLW